MDEAAPPPASPPRVAPPTEPGAITDRRRSSPAWPAVLGVLAIIFACLALGGTALELVLEAAGIGPPDPQPLVNHVHALAMRILGAALSVALLAAGIGMLGRRRWSIRLGRIWAVVWLVSGVVGSATMYAVAFGAHPGRQLEPFEQVSLILGATVGVVISVSIPAFVLWWLARRSVRDHWSTWH